MVQTRVHVIVFTLKTVYKNKTENWNLPLRKECLILYSFRLSVQGTNMSNYNYARIQHWQMLSKMKSNKGENTDQLYIYMAEDLLAIDMSSSVN